MRFTPDRAWRKTFALLPTRCGTCNHETGVAWLEWIEVRDVGSDCYELPSPFMSRTYRFINDPKDFDDTYPHRGRDELDVLADEINAQLKAG